MRKFLLLASVLAPCAALPFLPLSAAAQPIVVSATRVATPVGQVPADVTVLTTADFAAKGEITLAQALADVPGLRLVQSGGPGNAASLFVHGANSADVLVLMDGVPVNDPADANGAFNFGTYTLDDIERIEIIRGPMSGLYGSSAIGGVISITTTRGQGKPKASVTLAGGWPAQGLGSATVSGQTGKLDYAFSGGLNEQSGFDYVPKRMTSVYTGQHDPYRAKLGAAQIGYALTPTARLYGIYRYQAADAAFPNLGYPEYDDPNEFDYTTSKLAKLGLNDRLLGGRWISDVSVARLDTTLHNKNLLDANDPNAASADDHYAGRRNTVQWDNTLRLPDAGAALSSLTFGTDYTDDHAKEAVNESGYLAGLFASQHTWSGHVGAQTTLAQRVTLTGALREDSVSSFGDALTWRLGGVVAVPEADVRLKASVGTGFNAPSLFDLHYTDNYGDSGNPNLRPEASMGWELGPEFVLPGADLDVSYFASDIRDMIYAAYSNGGAATEENAARAHISGVESTLTLTPAAWLSVNVSYTYTHIQTATAAARERRPENAGSLSLTATPLPKLTLTPEVAYTGRFLDYLYGNDGYPTGIGFAHQGVIVNLTAGYALRPDLSLFATGDNILGSRFEAINGLSVPGASLLIGLRAALD